MEFRKDYFDYIRDLKGFQIDELNKFRDEYKNLADLIYKSDYVTDDMKERALENLLISLNLLNNGICKFTQADYCSCGNYDNGGCMECHHLFK